MVHSNDDVRFDFFCAFRIHLSRIVRFFALRYGCGRMRNIRDYWFHFLRYRHTLKKQLQLTKNGLVPNHQTSGVIIFCNKIQFFGTIGKQNAIVFEMTLKKPCNLTFRLQRHLRRRDSYIEGGQVRLRVAAQNKRANSPRQGHRKKLDFIVSHSLVANGWFVCSKRKYSFAF